mmetsp:Transcript_27147/g.45848  ORF Transcript_27147/g.45848 Transcript_27147/m.45848 type:complete len:258 (-) Transcript_27147:1701-2474(-)
MDTTSTMRFSNMFLCTSISPSSGDFTRVSIASRHSAEFTEMENMQDCSVRSENGTTDDGSNSSNCRGVRKGSLNCKDVGDIASTDFFLLYCNILQLFWVQRRNNRNKLFLSATVTFTSVWASLSSSSGSSSSNTTGCLPLPTDLAKTDFTFSSKFFDMLSKYLMRFFQRPFCRQKDSRCPFVSSFRYSFRTSSNISGSEYAPLSNFTAARNVFCTKPLNTFGSLWTMGEAIRKGERGSDNAAATIDPSTCSPVNTEK